MSLNHETRSAVDSADRVRGNQWKLRDGRSQYDCIVCGSGSSGSVVARRLAENPDVSVLVLEAGGSDEVPSVTEPARWVKVLGGRSSINGMGWARGHKYDWEFFASESGDTAWNYESVLKIYRRVEDWQGTPDPTRRGRPAERTQVEI